MAGILDQRVAVAAAVRDEEDANDAGRFKPQAVIFR